MRTYWPRTNGRARPRIFTRWPLVRKTRPSLRRPLRKLSVSLPGFGLGAASSGAQHTSGGSGSGTSWAPAAGAKAGSARSAIRSGRRRIGPRRIAVSERRAATVHACAAAGVLWKKRGPAMHASSMIDPRTTETAAFSVSTP